MSNPSHYSLLVVDDEPDLRTLYELTLLREGYDIETAGSVEEAWSLLADRSFSAVITDMRLPDGSGLDLLHRMERQGRREKAIVITAYGSPENAVEALKAGAFDYLTKPVDLRQFRTVVSSAIGRTPAVPGEARALGATAAGSTAGAVRPGKAEAPGAERPAPAPSPSARVSGNPGSGAAATGVTSVSPALSRLAGESAAMREVRALVEKVARSMAPVLVHGESGTGKELVARSIHEVSTRAAQPFVPVNCGAIPEQLLEAEFFGYRKGAFTGAVEDRGGFFQAASGGTLFLDEIGDLPLSMQSKLLRAIQERSVRPVGAVSEQPLDVRILSATHKDLAVEVQAGRFRQDLYYRLNVIQIRVPPLRERLEDLPAICHRVLERIARDAGVDAVPRLAGDALAQLARHAFPGNVRELENLLHRAVALTAGDVIVFSDLGLPDPALDEREAEDTPADAEGARAASDTAADDAEALPSDLAAHLDAVERGILVRALAQYRNNRTAAGASLGLSLRQMRYRMARLDVQVADAAFGPESERPDGA